ncbi:MAG: ThuA domain-containing protein [Elusimicrobiota bacterium]
MPTALITWGGWNGHQPEQCAAKTAAILTTEKFYVKVVNTLDVYTDKELMSTLDLIVPIWTMSKITKEQEKGLLAAISSGTGLAGFHGGMCDAFRENTEYQWMTGGQWVAHPGGVIEYEINISNLTDPITEGIRDFKIKSEQYYLHTDPGNKVLATTTFDGTRGNTSWIKGTVMPVVWKRQWGNGNVFYCSFGHAAAELDIPEAREILRRGMLWATKKV